MTCSVISVLCIRPRLIYREPRRGTGCAPGAHPGSSHASALPAYLLSFPLPLLVVSSPSDTHSSSPLSFHLLISVRGKGLAVGTFLSSSCFQLFLFRFKSISFRIFVFSSSFVYLVLNGVCEINNIPHTGNHYIINSNFKIIFIMF